MVAEISKIHLGSVPRWLWCEGKYLEDCLLSFTCSLTRILFEINNQLANAEEIKSLKFMVIRSVDLFL